jgi:hypothetical protein
MELEKYSNKIFEIKTNNEENIIKLSNFTRFSDNSSIYFDLFCRSNHLEIRNFRFYADFHSFKNFIHGFKKIYNELSGEVSIKTSFENDIIKIIALDNGGIQIHCEIYSYDGNNSEFCKLEFDVDQTYLMKMINEIDMIYKDLELI